MIRVISIHQNFILHNSPLVQRFLSTPAQKWSPKKCLIPR